MDGVAAEIAEEIGVLFQDNHFNAGAGEKKTKHHAGRSTAGDQATNGCARHLSILARLRGFGHSFRTFANLALCFSTTCATAAAQPPRETDPPPQKRRRPLKLSSPAQIRITPPRATKAPKSF